MMMIVHCEDRRVKTDQQSGDGLDPLENDTLDIADGIQFVCILELKNSLKKGLLGRALCD